MTPPPRPGRWILPLVVIGLILTAGYLGARWAGLVEVTRGDGWRLLTVSLSDPHLVLGEPQPGGDVVATPTIAAIAWAQGGGSGQLDLKEDEALLKVTAYGSSSCRLFLAGMDLGETGVVVHLSHPLCGGMSADAAPSTFFIAVTLDQLPKVPIEVDVRAQELGGSFTITEIH